MVLKGTIKILMQCPLRMEDLDDECLWQDAEITVQGYDDPGKLSGPPESCYPPESEAEIVEAKFLDGIEVSGDVLDKLYGKIADEFFEKLHDQPDGPGCDDSID